MNILILAAGESESLTEEGYPFCLTEFEGKPLIERMVDQCSGLPKAQFLFAIPESDIKRWHMDNVVAQLCPSGKLLPVKARSAGAACTALLAIDHINNEDPLLILNANDVTEIDFNNVLQNFTQRKLDAGTVVFHSVHPRYSYVSLDDSGYVMEAAEKNPISQHATTGFYWFARGRDFVTACQAMIAKDAHVDGKFYICPVLNELILRQAKISVHHIDNQHYHPLKSIRQMQHFENVLGTGRHA